MNGAAPPPRRRALGAAPADPDDGAAAIAAAFRILNGAAQTDVSLRHRLTARGFRAGAARTAAAEMARLGYIDDAAFAQAVAQRRLRRGYGRAAVAAELRARGVGEVPIGETLRGVGVDDERDAARRLAERLIAREHARRGHDDPRRIAGALRRRGFGADTIRDAIRAAWPGPGPVAADE